MPTPRRNKYAKKKKNDQKFITVVGSIVFRTSLAYNNMMGGLYLSKTITLIDVESIFI